MNYNLAQQFLNQHCDRPNKIAFRSQGQTMTFGELDRQSRQLAAYLIKLGLEPNDRIQFFLLDRIHTVVAFLAVMYAGGVVSLGNPRAGKQTHLAQLETIEPKFVLVESEYRYSLPSIAVNIDYAINKASEFEPLAMSVTKDHDDMAFIGWTSGTTGYTQAMRFAHGRHLQLTKNISKEFGWSDLDRVYCTSKMFFLWNLNSTVFNVLWNGGEAFLDDGLSIAYRVQKIINDYQPTIVNSVPVMYAQLIENGVPEHRNVQYWSAGDRLPEPVITRFKELTGDDIRVSYGNTEMAGPLTANFNPGVSIGRALNGWTARIVDDHGQVVTDNTTGKLEIKSKLQALGYWNRPDFDDDWWNTGDLVWSDDQGYMYYVCRDGDKLKINGQYISPSTIEEILHRHPEIVESAVVVRPDKYDIDQLEAFVIVTNNSTLTEPQLKTWIKTRCEHYLCPRVIHMVKDLPHTDTGKIQRYILRKSNEKIISNPSKFASL
jgi:benzoate-CoA ligase